MDKLDTVCDLLAEAVKEAGARHSKSDMAKLQTIHDHTIALGASCPMGEADHAKTVNLIESGVAFPTDYVFAESEAINPIVKIIDAGRGSSGYYTKEVLQRDGPGIFKAGTLMYVNHATAAEEAARPEGDWSKLAAVTVGNAYWDEAGKAGPALYAPAKVFSDHAAQVKEKAPYTGVSIRAGGKLNEKKVGPDGKPGVIEALTHAASIDLVTKAGRGGKMLLEAQHAINLFEAARTRHTTTEGETDMDKAEVERLIKESVTAALAPLQEENKKLRETVLQVASPAPKRGKSIKRVIETLLNGGRLPEVYADLITERVKANYPLLESGLTDEAKLTERVNEELKRIAPALSRDTGRVLNLGATAIADPKIAEAAEKRGHDDYREAMTGVADIFLDINEETSEATAKLRRERFIKGRAA